MTDIAERFPRAVERSITSVVAPRVRVEGDVLLGIGTSTPRLTWSAVDRPTSGALLRLELRRSSGERATHETTTMAAVQVEWPFAPLRSRERVQLRATARSGNRWGAPGPWVGIEAGLLSRNDWAAEWITPGVGGAVGDPAPVLRRDIILDQEPVGARLYVTARGLYDFSIDGERVGDAALTPGWTTYRHRLRYQTYDVGHLVHIGVNRLSVLLGNGWYRGQLVWPGNRSVYGDRLALLAQLEIRFADGSTRVFSTDSQWSSADSFILADDLYDGEVQDLRLPQPKGPARPVRILDDDGAVLEAPVGPPVRALRRVVPISFWRSARGSLIVDFGQNIVGHVRLRTQGRPGAEVLVKHAEVLEDGMPAYRPLRSAKATCRYILSGAEETLEPRFTFSGFRYAEITGIAELEECDVEAVVMSSDMRRIGWFHCSDPRLNRLHENIVWSMRGNFVDLPTDCPQRDERLGWTGDIQVFAPTATFLFDTAGLLRGWLRDLAADQHENGAVPDVIPDVLGNPHPGSAGWGDAAVIVPMALWRAYGDRAVLEAQYPSMKAWVEYVRGQSPDDVWSTGFQYGDWLDPTAPPEDPADGLTDRFVVATAYYARSVRLLAEAADALVRPSDAREYRALHGRIARAFDREYVAADGTVRSDSQTAYALAIVEDLIVGSRQRLAAEQRLATLVTDAGFRVATGFLGTPVILEALTRIGRADLAAQMLRQREGPSWLYAVDMGATTMWERWDALQPDGSVHPGSMTSFNHYAYGAVATWMHERLAGLRPAAAGYERVRIEPATTAGLDHVAVQHLTPFGLIAVAWRAAPRFELEATIPPGVTAEVLLPNAAASLEVGAGSYVFTVDPRTSYVTATRYETIEGEKTA